MYLDWVCSDRYLSDFVLFKLDARLHGVKSVVMHTGFPPVKGRVDSKLGNFAASRIQIHYFGRQISTFCQANTLKTECVVHWIVERETTGPTLRFQRKIS